MKQEHELWYARPAGNWSEALPLGNGRLGAMVFGGASQDRLQLNEDTLYSGKPVDRINPAALGELPRVRRLLAEDRVEEAELLAQDALSAMPRYNGAYQPLCDLYIRTPEVKVEQGSYRRSLDLSEGVAHTRYAAGGVNYARTYFASLAHGVLAVRLRADAPGALAFAANLMRRPFDPGSFVSEAGDIVMAGEASPGGVAYACAVRVCCAQGTQTAFGDAIRVRGAQEAWIFVAAATTYRHEDPVRACEKALDALKPFSFDHLLEA
ncbi:MAG TPA: glycoside hydrolase family 95 protein, partial [Clostridia bacterium]|nr:glycoside hydrolase family 95 protein [Clostridia bacterium]